MDIKPETILKAGAVSMLGAVMAANTIKRSVHLPVKTPHVISVSPYVNTDKLAKGVVDSDELLIVFHDGWLRISQNGDRWTVGALRTNSLKIFWLPEKKRS